MYKSVCVPGSSVCHNITFFGGPSGSVSEPSSYQAVPLRLTLFLQTRDKWLQHMDVVADLTVVIYDLKLTSFFN